MSDSGIIKFGKWLSALDWNETSESENNPTSMADKIQETIDIEIKNIFPENTMKISNKDVLKKA